MLGVTDYQIPELVRQCGDLWPWSGQWLRYDSLGECKLALRVGIRRELAVALEWLDTLCPAGLVADLTRHGAGLHMMPVGGFLDPHLDCDRHPATGYRRAKNAILFLDDFEPDWGGDLCLYSADLSGECQRVTPKAGRVAIFDCDDASYHGVPGPIVGPIPRRSLAVYWWEPIDWPAKRPRAQFVALANEKPNPEKDQWRIARSAAAATPG